MTDEDRIDDLEDILEEPSFADMKSGKKDSDNGLSEKKSRVQFLNGLFKTRLKLMIISAGGILLILIFTGLFMFFTGSDEDTSDMSVGQSTDVAVGTVPSGLEDQIIFEDIVELEPFERIHLKNSSTMGLITLGVALELTDGQYRKQIHLQEDRIRQTVITQAGEMTWLELRNPDGKIRLKYELLKRINSLYPQVTVRNIYFTYFIMQ